MNHLSMVLTRVNPWMDLEAAADYSGVSYAELVSAASSGRLAATLTHTRRPGEWMARLDDIDVWLASRTAIPGWSADGAA